MRRWFVRSAPGPSAWDWQNCLRERRAAEHKKVGHTPALQPWIEQGAIRAGALNRSALEVSALIDCRIILPVRRRGPDILHAWDGASNFNDFGALREQCLRIRSADDCLDDAIAYANRTRRRCGRHLAASAMGGKVYIVGGRFQAGFQSEQTDRVEAYDPRTNEWKFYPPMIHPRGGLNAVAANGCLHVFGGEGANDKPNGVHPDHDVYHPFTDSWTMMAPIPTPVHGVTGMAFFNGLIHLPGGGTSIGGSSGSTLHQVYRPSMTCR